MNEAGSLYKSRILILGRMKKMNFTANDVEQMIENQRAFYFTGATKDVEFRKEQLVKLKETIKNMKIK